MQLFLGLDMAFQDPLDAQKIIIQLSFSIVQ